MLCCCLSLIFFCGFGLFLICFFCRLFLSCGLFLIYFCCRLLLSDGPFLTFFCCGLFLIFLCCLLCPSSSESKSKSKDVVVVSDVTSLDTGDHDVIFSVAASLEKVFNGKAYVGLRIPDPDAASASDSDSRLNCDLVLLTKCRAWMISVKNMAGCVSVNSDGSWVCTSDHDQKEENYPNPVAEANWQACVLESYIKQRGVSLPKGLLLYKVIIPNPKFQTLNRERFQREVLHHDQWVRLITESKSASSVSEWIKGVSSPVKEQMHESTFQQLQFVLSTAPMWDRLELKGSKYVLGEFQEFKGGQRDVEVLKVMKRSKVGQMIVQNASLFGLDLPMLKVLYSFRDYRIGASASERKMVIVGLSTELLFRPQNSKKVQKFKLSTVSSLSLSA